MNSNKLKKLVRQASELTQGVEVNLEKLIEEQTMTESTSKVKELSAEEKAELRAKKKAARRAGMTECGRLALSNDQKEHGFTYRVCNVLPGNIENWQSKGYEIVTHEMKSGSGSLATPEVNGKPSEFEVGGAKGSMKAVWMRISDEDKSILDEIRDEDAQAQDNQIRKNPGIPKDQLVGKITKGYL